MKKLALVSILFTVVFAACKENKEKTETEEVEKEIEKEVVEKSEIKTITFSLESKSESTAKGEVTFVEDNGVVKMTANLTGLTPGEHAIHIHEKADCSAADATSSGGHWNPTFAPHGQWGDEGGFHLGDIGNFVADDSGSAIVSKKTDLWCIGCGDEKKDILGKAIIVHQGVDDYTSQPSGAAGARISCGGIIE